MHSCAGGLGSSRLIFSLDLCKLPVTIRTSVLWNCQKSQRYRAEGFQPKWNLKCDCPPPKLNGKPSPNGLPCWPWACCSGSRGSSPASNLARFSAQTKPHTKERKWLLMNQQFNIVHNHAIMVCATEMLGKQHFRIWNYKTMRTKLFSNLERWVAWAWLQSKQKKSCDQSSFGGETNQQKLMVTPSAQITQTVPVPIICMSIVLTFVCQHFFCCRQIDEHFLCQLLVLALVVIWVPLDRFPPVSLDDFTLGTGPIVQSQQHKTRQHKVSLSQNTQCEEAYTYFVNSITGE